jgi:hypothetical protein
MYLVLFFSHFLSIFFCKFTIESTKGMFGSTILIIAFLKIVFLKSLLFKIAQAFGKIC